MKEYISKAKEGIFLALGVFQKYFGPGSSPRETEVKKIDRPPWNGMRYKFHTYKKIYRRVVAQVYNLVRGIDCLVFP